MQPERKILLLSAIVACAWLLFAPLSAGVLSLAELHETLDEARAAVSAADYPRAETLDRRAVDGSADLPGSNLPLARAVDGLGDVYRLSDRPEEAAGLYERSARMWESLLGPDQPRLATTLHNLGLVHAAMGRPERALPALARALTIWEATLGSDSFEARNTRRAVRRLSQSAE